MLIGFSGTAGSPPSSTPPPRLWNIFVLNSSSRGNKRSKQKEVNQSFIGRRSWEQDIPTDNTELNIWHHIQLDRIAMLSHEGPSVVFNIDALLRHWLDLPPRPLSPVLSCSGTQRVTQQTQPRPRVLTVLTIMLQCVLFLVQPNAWSRK